jgi:cytochrome P450
VAEAETAIEPDFFSDPDVIADPFGYLKLMRSKCPVAKERHQGAFMVTGYDELGELLTAKGDTFSSCLSILGPLPPLPFKPQGSDIRDQLENVRDSLPWSAHLACMDGQKHTDHRALLTALLTYKRLKQNEAYLLGLADRMIDRFIADGLCNVVPQYGHAITTYAISDLLGIPEEHRALLLEQIGAPPSQIDGESEMKIGPDPLVGMKELFDGYFTERLETPQGDLMTELAQSKFRDGTPISFEAMSLLARFLFGAGQDTTSHLISMAIRILAERPELQQRLRANPERIADFLEEVLRFDPPVKVGYRLALEDTELAGVAIPAGSVLTACLSGANRDPRHFDNPDVFDIDRAHLRDHMAFSRGSHGCPGAPLARMEARIAIERILARTAQFHPAEVHHGPAGNWQYRFIPTYSFRSLADLHIEYTAA